MNAEIHDLGHVAYRGPRTRQARRFLVIARNVFAVAWRSKWGVKLPLILAAGITFAASVVMYVLRLDLAETVRARGAPIPKAELIVYMAGSFYEFVAFLLGAVVGCAAVANDLRMGAFQFYFARAIRPRDYVAGKVVGLCLVIGIPMLLGPLVLAMMRLVYAENGEQALALSPVVPQALAHGLLGTLAYVLPAAGIGALTRKRQTAQALYAIYFMLVAPATMVLAENLEVPVIRALSLPSDLTVLGMWIFGLPHSPEDPPVWLSAVSLAVLTGLGFAAVWWRVRRAETAGLATS